MRSLFDLIIKHSYVILFVVLETLSLVLLFGFNDPQKKAFMTSASGVSGSVLEVSSAISGFFAYGKENSELAAENARLQAELFMLRDSIADSRLPSTDNSILTARVIDNSIRKDDNYITLNRGTMDGIRQGMGVYDSKGVVGVIMLAAKHYSIVLPVINGKSSISCKIKGDNSFGFLEWSGGDASVAELRDLPYYATINVGDTVVTSGYSDIFPEGIDVGVVSNVQQLTSGYTLKVNVQLAADLSNLGWVYINTAQTDVELKELLNQIKQ
ncbi:MAG: rod shape-determining protein MreC [Bacteroidaceae bacterium]|nr:rod shape-determining protein MreC [Bacteroidaceae bacterium]